MGLTTVHFALAHQRVNTFCGFRTRRLSVMCVCVCVDDVCTLDLYVRPFGSESKSERDARFGGVRSLSALTRASIRQVGNWVAA